ncbi:predicted protein [Arabidopsis lyrata subsp. lyrata]|uniref:Predicted protein n=1 Tax=Arabidopsis lyrata subsp. lyrata TaxID=81972 RepID=D7MM52_ARALL|nr:predicted protein [Arabidopsis lyrata subsp. lyrata]
MELTIQFQLHKRWCILHKELYYIKLMPIAFIANDFDFIEKLQKLLKIAYIVFFATSIRIRQNLLKSRIEDETIYLNFL